MDYLKGRLGECSARAGGFAAERVWGWFEHPMGGGDALVREVKSPGASRVSRRDLAVGGVTDARLGYKSPNGPKRTHFQKWNQKFYPTHTRLPSLVTILFLELEI